LAKRKPAPKVVSVSASSQTAEEVATSG
jgi:hypothetical protein